MSFHVTVACPFATDTEHANTGSVDAANEATGAITAIDAAIPTPAGTIAFLKLRPPDRERKDCAAERKRLTKPDLFVLEIVTYQRYHH